MKQGRVIEEHKTRYTISSEDGVYSAVVRGIFHKDTSLQGKIFPKVGDYVEYKATGDHEAVIENLLPRTTVVVRAVFPKGLQGASVTSEVIVANVDIIFIVVGLDKDFNLSRIERYVLLARKSNVDAVILLNKSDVVLDPTLYIEQIKHRLPHIPVHAISAEAGINVEIIRTYITAETTAVLLGSSGAGKSTITNWLLGKQEQLTRSVRKNDSSGRHTTTSRQLFAIPTGGYLIDTPGIRELGVLSTEEDEADTFSSINLLQEQCQFTDCDHEKSEGCAILDAIASGQIDRKHFENYLKLKREREYTESKVATNSDRQYKNKKRKQDTAYNSIQKRKRSEGDFFFK